MSTFADVRAEMVGKLAAAGLPATADPAANVPCVLVGLATVDTAAGIGGWGATIPVRILVPPPGDLAAGTALEDMLTVVLVTLGFARAIPTTYRMSTAGVEVPCYELTYPREIPNPNC